MATPVLTLDGDDVTVTVPDHPGNLQLCQLWLSPDGVSDWAMALEREDRANPWTEVDFNFEQPFIRARWSNTYGASWSEWSNVEEWVP